MVQEAKESQNLSTEGAAFFFQTPAFVLINLITSQKEQLNNKPTKRTSKGVPKPEKDQQIQSLSSYAEQWQEKRSVLPYF
uniref:Uncharacterized protein n=1 Tax=Arundo donax TaxID=35708 RepID=A0A0A9D5F8_ARUDO